MLNTFPQLLAYGFGSYFFAPTILRIAAAIIFVHLAYAHYGNKEAISKTRFPILGEGAWIPWLAIAVESAVALILFFGYHTQIGAILGALIALKAALWSGTYPKYFILSRSAAFLLFVICLCLLITGAGGLAFDLPL